MPMLETNVFEGELPKSVVVRALSINYPSLNESDEQGEFQKKLYKLAKRRMNAFVHHDKIYFLGKDNALLEDIKILQYEYPDLKFNEFTDVKLTLPEDLIIIRNLLYSSFEEAITKKGYAVRFRKGRDKVAIPSFETLEIDGKKYKLVENTAARGGIGVYLIDSFYYRIHVSANGKINLVIDPKISVLIPFNNVPQDIIERSFLSVICFHDSDQRGGCELLQRNSVKYIGLAKNESLPNTKCVNLANQFCEVVDVKNNTNLVLPSNILYVEGHPSELGIYDLVRRRSLKDSKTRREYTKVFAKHLSTENGKIEVPFGKINIRIQNSPIVLPIKNNLPTKPISQAKILGEPKLIFTNSPIYVSQRDGLLEEGPYSRNNQQMSYHPEKIILHILYPKSKETIYKTYIEKLVSGSDYYPGFKILNPPFYADIQPLYYPLSTKNLLSYQTMISQIRGKINKRNNVIFAILSDDFTGYSDLKSLCYQHNIPSQFIKESTISKNLNSRYLQYYLWNLAIAIYAKAGGTPWRVDSTLLQHTDCYLGIQTKIQQEGRFSPNTFFVGAADIFNSMGEYISCAVHQGISKTMDGLHVDSEFMKNLVIRAVERYKAETDLKPKKIVVHRQLNFNKAELQGLQDGLDQVSANCPCIIVHLQEGHHFRGYPQDESFIVDRTTYYTLGKRSVVLFLTGKTQGRYSGIGTPKPTQVNFKIINSEKELDYNEIEKMCRSILGFTRLRWNTTRIAIRRPLTTFAADKIGEMAKKGFINLQYRDIRDFL
ncbi:MAG: Piwi domain-containing protein [Candidatus Odinarchaeia archaeon]